MHTEQNCDVLIIGASMAGSCLARQLSLQLPQLKIVQIERKTEFGAWVGESTIEVFYDYCVRTLKLGHYLESTCLSKHGLRFFFDSPEKDLRLTEMSEMGRSWHLPIPSFQVDRAKFDQDLVDMNLKGGIEVHLGVKVKNIEIDKENGHQVQTSNGTFRCRYLVDAAGFGSPLSRKIANVRKDDPEHPIGSYWGRYEGCPNFDDLGDDQWHKKVNYTSRFLSTNHFMYRGYWVWVIPLNQHSVSIGVCFRRDMQKLAFKNGEQMDEFFKSHTALNQVIGSGRCVDFAGLKVPQRLAEKPFSEDRWFMTGMSAGFVDAMFSNSCSYLADMNHLIGDAIKADLQDTEKQFISRIKHYNLYSNVWYETVKASVQGMYSGNFDVQMGIYMPNLFGYFGTSLPSSMSGLKTLTASAIDHADGCACSLEAISIQQNSAAAVPRLLRQVNEFLEFAKRYDPKMTNNRGEFYESSPPYSILKLALDPHAPRPEGEDLRIQVFSYEFGMRYFLKRMADLVGVKISDVALNALVETLYSNDLSLNEAFEKLLPDFNYSYNLPDRSAVGG